MNLFFANALLFTMVAVELSVMKWGKKEKIPWGEIISNINSGHLVLWIFRSLALSVYCIILASASLHLEKFCPVILQWIAGFLLWDLCFYWSHRCHHKYGWLWAVHVVHHEGEHFNLSLGLRNSWYSSLTSFPFFAILPFLGLPFQIFASVSGFHYLVQFYNHSQHDLGPKWLGRFMVTPTHHKVHHGKNEKYLDRNFGGTLVIWDRLFGTYQEESADDPIRVGVDHPLNSSNPALMSNHFMLPESEKCCSQKHELPGPALFPVLATCMLVILLLFYTRHEAQLALTQKIVIVVIAMLGTISIGGMQEGKRWSSRLWALAGLSLIFFACLSSLPGAYFAIGLAIFLLATMSVVASK